jgi:hypothetical protein
MDAALDGKDLDAGNESERRRMTSPSNRPPRSVENNSVLNASDF